MCWPHGLTISWQMIVPSLTSHISSGSTEAEETPNLLAYAPGPLAVALWVVVVVVVMVADEE